LLQVVVVVRNQQQAQAAQAVVAQVVCDAQLRQLVAEAL
jgi:hypothetical protein